MHLPPDNPDYTTGLKEEIMRCHEVELDDDGSLSDLITGNCDYFDLEWLAESNVDAYESRCLVYTERCTVCGLLNQQSNMHHGDCLDCCIEFDV